MIRIIGIAAVALALCGCSTTTPAERLASNQASCQGYGFKPNTDAYSTCMMQMDLEAKSDDQRRRAAIADALSNMGQSMQPSRRVTCNTFGSARNTGYGAFGNSTTTCY
ncbi:hypothetical protein [Devosia sp.]|uniref:hypothetical protein n=1 Tax=Devosia sp. TaxID=1871048 RepID=UPI00292D62C3|nr:hypothetical protein [Devosia sp.]